MRSGDLIEKLTATPVLWALFVLSLVLMFMFQAVSSAWDLRFVDAISSPPLVREVIAGFSDEQRTVHAWATATIDVAFPLAYGLFFAGSALCFFPGLRFLALPGLAVIPVDVLEGVVQVLALLDIADFIDTKAILTPLKMALFYAGALIAIAGWLRWTVSRANRSKAS